MVTSQCIESLMRVFSSPSVCEYGMGRFVYYVAIVDRYTSRKEIIHANNLDGVELYLSRKYGLCFTKRRTLGSLNGRTVSQLCPRSQAYVGFYAIRLK